MAARPSRTPILADLVGGISLTGLMIPEAVAYSSIAGLPAAFGITAAVAGPLAYATVGQSRLAVVTATSGSAALLAAAIASAAIPNVSRTDCAIAFALLVGLFFMVGAVLRVGALTSFISRAVLHGFGFGLAVTISIRQLPKLVGLSSPSGGPAWQTLGSFIPHLFDAHIPSLLLGVGALLILVAARRLRLVAAGLIVIVAATLAMRLGPIAQLGIATAGSVAFQLGIPGLPPLTARDWARLAQFALPIAIVLLAESWATMRSLASPCGERVSSEREIAALGLANLASALLRGMPVGAGFSISNANAHAGTASRKGAMIAAIAVALFAAAGASWVASIPEPVLAAIVITALMHALSPEPIIALFRLNRDQWVAVAAAGGVLLFGIINGLLIAVGLSVLGLLRRLAYPQLSELGRTGAHDFVDCSAHPEARPIRGILVIRPNAPLFFANADETLAKVGRRARQMDARAIVLSLEESDDLDSTALDAITDFRQAMEAQGRSLILARAHDRVRSVLERGGLNELAATSTFSVDDAVRTLTSKGEEEAVRPGPHG